MRRYIAWRLASAVLVMVGVSVVTFLFLHLEPGSAARTLLGEHATPRAIAALQKQWGLNSSLPSQFVRYIVESRARQPRHVLHLSGVLRPLSSASGSD